MEPWTKLGCLALERSLSTRLPWGSTGSLRGGSANLGATAVLSFPLVGQSERVPRAELSSLDITGLMVLASQHAVVIRFSCDRGSD